jgi:hypothetical protein
MPAPHRTGWATGGDAREDVGMRARTDDEGVALTTVTSSADADRVRALAPVAACAACAGRGAASALGLRGASMHDPSVQGEAAGSSSTPRMQGADAER